LLRRNDTKHRFVDHLCIFRYWVLGVGSWVLSLEFFVQDIMYQVQSIALCSSCLCGERKILTHSYLLIGTLAHSHICKVAFAKFAALNN